jgi:DNA primase
MSLTDEIKNKITVLDLVSEFVELKKQGRLYKSVCPFHSEKTASFIVDSDKNIWRCFGACSTGGDIFSFMMKKENLSFLDSLEFLRKKLGISTQNYNSQKFKEIEEIKKINYLALKFFRSNLFSSEGENVRNYLKNRGIEKESAINFDLGYNPRGKKLSEYLQNKDYALESLIQYGLISKSAIGKELDFFSDRLIFPIKSQNDDILGFGGRVLSDRNPKYINTKKNSLFDKGAVLYGIDQAFEYIRDNDECVLVEGYTDVIIAHQYGFKNVVASMGTAITVYQASKIAGISNAAIIALDSDQAGTEATLNALDKSWGVFSSNSKDLPTGITNKSVRKNFLLRVIDLPEDTDPDSFIRKSPELWKTMTDNAKPIIEYLIKSLALRFDSNTPEGKELVEETVKPFISQEKNPYVQDQYIAMLSSELNVSEQRIRAGFDNKSKIYFNSTTDYTNSAITPDKKNRLLLLSEHLISLIISNNITNKDLLNEWDIEMIDDTICKQILYEWIKGIDQKILDENLNEKFNELKSDKFKFFDNQILIDVINKLMIQIEREYLLIKNNAVLTNSDFNELDIKEQIISIQNRIKDIDISLSSKINKYSSNR